MAVDAPDQASAKPPANFPKQAVVVIHGIGEQVPMDTITAFVQAAWETDINITQNSMPEQAEVWSKPDLRTGSLELRRITTRQSISTPSFEPGVRTDFYELYWADLSMGSTLEAIETWIKGLLLRNPCKNVPQKVFGAWVVLWLLSLGILYLLAAPIVKPTGALLGWHPYGWLADLPSWFGTAIGLALAYGANLLLKPYVGRVVRYTSATPENIAARKDIRERGLKLLNALHSGEYERIIVVGHSLGSMLGYDLINYFWAARLASHTVRQSSAEEFAAFRAVEVALTEYRANRTPENLTTYRTAQQAYGSMLRRRKRPAPKTDGGIDSSQDGRWLISDFVTLGSPLTHADFLLTSNFASFKDRVETRQYSVAPPVREILDPQYLAQAQAAGLLVAPSARPELLSFPFPPDNWQMHHAAPFAATTWTNIYDPARFILCGDFISGPLKPLFGDAVVDINLAELRGQSWCFTHTKYWDQDPKKKQPEPHIAALREALNLAGQTRLV
jgi:hypothetical protein